MQDMETLARLHAALDSVVETEQLLASVRETSAIQRPAVARVAALVVEARELLRGLLVHRHGVGNAGSR